MADKSPIEWLRGGDDRQGATWNIITGCSVISAGCKHCYAMRLAGTRMRQHPSRVGLTQQTTAGPVWNGLLRFNEEWLNQPRSWRRPRMIFVCGHGDLFHEAVPDEWIDRVFTVMAISPQHIFIVLTKRAQRMRDYMIAAHTSFAARALSWPGPSVWPLPNVWLGVSVETQDAADERIPLLLQTPAAVRWVSAEPLLGPVRLWKLGALDFDEHSAGCEIYALSGTRAIPDCDWKSTKIDWVVCGGESGARARPMHPDWARSLRDQCAADRVPFFFKQWGEWLHESQSRSCSQFSVTDDRQVHEWPEGTASYRVGKKSAGRLLDGVLHDAYPESRT